MFRKLHQHTLRVENFRLLEVTKINNGLDSSFVQHVCLCCDWLIFQSSNKCQFIVLSNNGSDTTFRTYRLDHSFVTFFGCGTFIWIPVPTLFHQLFPEGWRHLATRVCRPLRCQNFEWAYHQGTGRQPRNSPNSGWVAHDCGKKHWVRERA